MWGETQKKWSGLISYNLFYPLYLLLADTVLDLKTGEMPGNEEGSGLEEEDEPISDGDTNSVEKKKSKPVYSGRGVTLTMLMNEQLIEPGELCMSIEYLVSKNRGTQLKHACMSTTKCWTNPSKSFTYKNTSNFQLASLVPPLLKSNILYHQSKPLCNSMGLHNILSDF